MGITENFAKQHKEILGVVENIITLLGPHKLSKDSSQVINLLTQLVKNLDYHLKMEDDGLYPALMRHPDTRVRALARRYSKEMGDISYKFKEHMARWLDEKSIKGNSPDFIIETTIIFNALSERIDKENKILYPLLSTYCS